MKNIAYILLTLLISISVATAQDHTKEIMERANDFITNLNQEKYKEVVDMVHPNILKMGGGKESMAIIFTEERNMLNGQGYQILKSEVLEPTNTALAGDEIHAIVPVKQLVQIGKAKFNSTSYLLAASADEGKTWTLAKLDGHDDDSIKFFFPKWNSELKVPQPEQSIAIDTPTEK